MLLSKKIFFTLQLLLMCLALSAQQKTYTVKRAQGKIKIDGKLNEAAWQQANIATDFTQTIPQPLERSTQNSEVKMLYDETAIYVSAVLYQDRSMMRAQLTARDEIGNANTDIFGVYFDTYRDKQNGFAFKVTAAGAQQEERLINGGNGDGNGDRSWDAVWTSKVSITDSAWIVEIEIPFQAVRFPKNDIQDWGIQFSRSIRMKRENSFWNTVDPRETGFLAQAGKLNGLHNIEPPVRLIFFPYLSTGWQQKPTATGIENRWLRSGGMDVKYGINEAFTFDMTLIPDFSQVISDQIIRNVSAFEQQLNENRPFFTEGVELFNKQGLFYSRRVGATPGGYNSARRKYEDSRYTVEQNPNVTPLYNSFKISGRTEKKLGIGLFNALAAPVKAKVTDNTTGENIVEETEPLTNYSVFVLDQGLKGQSFINFTNTNVTRNGGGRDANVSALLLKLFDKENKYSFRFNQATSMNTDNSTGTKWIGRFDKISGKIRLAQQIRYLSPKYDQTDLGLQFDRNDLYSYSQFRYFENKPKAKHLQLYNIYLNNILTYNAQPFSFRRWELSATYFMLLKNFWDISFTLESTPYAPVNFYQLGSFGERIKEFPYLFTNLRGSTDSRKRIYWGYDYGFGKATIKPNPNYIDIRNWVRYRFNDHLEATIRYDWRNNESNVGYSFYESSIDRPIVAFRNIVEHTAQLNVTYNFTPNLNLTGRFRHYNSNIKNKSLHTTSPNSDWQSNEYTDATAADYDENYNLQNVDVFLNWMYAPGSRMVLSYKQYLNDAYILNSERGNSFGDNLFQVIERPKAFEVSLRFIYFLDYNKMKNFLKKKENKG